MATVQQYQARDPPIDSLSVRRTVRQQDQDQDVLPTGLTHDLLLFEVCMMALFDGPTICDRNRRSTAQTLESSSFAPPKRVYSSLIELFPFLAKCL
jgi:hypothetical protein